MKNLLETQLNKGRNREVFKPNQEEVLKLQEQFDVFKKRSERADEEKKISDILYRASTIKLMWAKEGKSKPHGSWLPIGSYTNKRNRYLDEIKNLDKEDPSYTEYLAILEGNIKEEEEEISYTLNILKENGLLTNEEFKECEKEYLNSEHSQID